MRRPQGRTLAWIGGAVGCLVVLGVIYQLQRHPHATTSPGMVAATTVQAELVRRGVSTSSVACQASHLDPSTLPAVKQVASLHTDQSPLLYDCTATLRGKPTGKDPGGDKAWCVLGFTGSAPWIAYDTEHGCSSMVATA